MASDTVPSRYDEAVESLYSPLHQARSPEALKQASARRLDTIADMQEYMTRIGLPSFSFPHVIHITGTKGKGSTACMCEAILRERYNLQTGLFTSPHLVDIGVYESDWKNISQQQVIYQFCQDSFES